MFVETKDAGEVQQPKVDTLKLSHLIRDGAKLRPQCRGVYGNVDDKTSCAIGAAIEARYGTFPWDAKLSQVREVCELAPGLSISIFRKNDSGWTREQIADWLESQGY